MQEVRTGRSTRTSLPSATSTWRSAAGQERGPVKIAAGHLEKEQVLDEALDEYCQLRANDNSLTASQFCTRYPSYRHSLRRLIDVHDAWDTAPELEGEVWPELREEFLGYQVLHELGVGAIARVYLAAEPALGGRLVAIKVSQHGGDEAETLGRLTHPNIVPVFSVKHDDKTEMTAVCMPYLGSATLADLVEIGFEGGKPPTTGRVILDAACKREQVVGFAEKSEDPKATDLVLTRGSYVDGVVRLGIQMAEALAYTHEQGILHRDLKPSNVLLTPTGIPMLLDFNLATDIESGARRLGGTLPYMPPEQIQDVHLQPFNADLAGDPRSDIFSLGVILYELLTGQLPFGDPPACASPREAAASYLKKQLHPPTPIRQRNPLVDARLAETIDRCLSLDIDRRPESAVQLIEQLQQHFGLRAKLKQYRLAFLVFILIASLAITGRIRASLDRVPDSVRNMQLAIDAFEAEDYDQAIKHFDDAEEAEGMATVPILLGRGYCYQQKNMLPIALSELKQASDMSHDPLVADCYAYNAAVTQSFSSAIATYQRTNRQDGGNAMRYVSLAYCKLNNEYKPSVIISDLNEAIKRDPKLQIAYHIRANANKSAQLPEHFPISNSITDIEMAFRTGHIYPQLHRDAACIYAIASIKDLRFLEKTKLHLTAAIDAGFSRFHLRQQDEFEPWKDESWFLDTLAKASTHGTAINRDSLKTASLLKQSSLEIISWLRSRSGA
jgi:serine/threonine protein kinase